MSNASYKMVFKDNKYSELIDFDNIVKSVNGYWARLKGENENLSKAFYSSNLQDWVPAYKAIKRTSSGMSELNKSKTQEGKVIFKAGSKTIGRNVLTWYAANGGGDVDYYNKEIDHIDGDYTNDSLSNLERTSKQENNKRRFRTRELEYA